MNLNPEQQDAVENGDGFSQILSGPGAGKTTTLVARYSHLRGRGVNPENILAVTFTVESAKNMRDRAGAPEKTVRPSGFMTMHSFCLSFVMAEAANFPYRLNEYFPLATPGVSAKFVFQSLRGVPGVKYRNLSSYISSQKRRGISPDAAIAEAVEPTVFAMARAYKEYDAKLRREGLLDFDSIILETANLLSSNVAVYDRWQYEHVLVDEAQDIDATQWAIIRQISQDYKNVFAVGDTLQALYGWRGADPDLFANFGQMFSGAKTFYMGQNYRSTKSIVAFVKEIAPVKEGLAEHFCTENEQGDLPVLRQFGSNLEESEGVASAVMAKIGPTDSVVILGRTNKILASFEEHFLRNNVKYHLLGKSGFWHQPEIRNVMAFVNLVQGPMNHAVIAALRAPFLCSRIRGKKALADSIAAQVKNNILGGSALSALTNTPEAAGLVGVIRSLPSLQGKTPSQIVSAVLTTIKAVDHYDEQDLPEIDNSPVENLQELVRIADRFASLHEFLDHARRAVNANRARKNRVILSTVHQAKGLQWPHVYVVGVQEGILPHKNSDNILEEHRIFFVAASRAAKTLNLSFCGKPSRFVSEVMYKPDILVVQWLNEKSAGNNERPDLQPTVPPVPAD